MSTTPDSALADPQQIIADLQRELAERTAERDEASRRLDERTAERDEALQREIAAAEVLQVINSSPGDLAPVFEAMLEKARVLCGFAHGDFNIYDGEYFRTVAFYAMPEAFAELLRQPRRPSGAAERLLQGEEVVHIADMTAMEFSISPDEAIRRAAVEAGLRTVLFVPLRKDGALLGYITANRREVRPFTDKQIALLQNFAAQAVIAMENARLITETREALEQQTATAEVLQVINSSPGDLAPVFDAMLEKAIRVCDAEAGVLLTYDGEYFSPVAYRGLAEFPSGPIRSHPETGSGRLARGEDIVHIIDSASGAPVDARDPGRLALLQLGGARTQVAAALRKEGRLLGSFTIWRREVRPFTEKQIALLRNFAAQAVIAMVNARLLTETREALEQQTATAEVLQIINSSPGDLAPVFDAMLERAMRLCEAAFGVLWTFEGELGHAAALRGVPPAFAEFLTRGPHRESPGTANSRLRRGEPVLQIADIADDDAYRSGDPVRRALVELGGGRTMLGVPLRKDDALLGSFIIYRQEVRPFSDKQIALLENFAAQAVIAMENARLLTETREALDQQTATAEVLQVINSSPGDLAPVFDAMLEKATRLAAASFGILMTYDGESFHTVALHGVPHAYGEYLRTPICPGPLNGLGRLLSGERLIHITDITADKAYAEGDPLRKATAELGGSRTHLLVPLVKDASLLGTFVIYRQEVRPFSDKQIALLENFAAQAVIAMENARLITETREALEQQTATAEVLGVINSSPGDLPPVFDAMLERAMRLCGAAFGELRTYDGERFRLAATHGVPSAYREYYTTHDTGIYGPGTGPARILAGERIVHVPDLVATEPYRRGDPDRHALVDLGAARAILLVPLFNDDAVCGYIMIYRREPGPFSNKQIALLQNFAAQAVIAMENARLITETREALEQQTATAEVLQVINSSPGDLAPVFDAMLEKAHNLCGATIGALEIWDGARIRGLATRGLPGPLEDLVRQGYQPGPNDPHWRLVNGAPFVHIPDQAVINEPTHQKAVELGGFRTFLGVALRKDDILLGRIVAARREVRPFTDKQIALLQNFAAQAVIAMENARLLGELRERTDALTRSVTELQTLEEVLRAVNSSLDLDTVLATIISRAALLSQADEGTIYEFDSAEEVFVPKSAFGMSAERVDGLRERRVRLGETHLGRAAVLRAPVHVEDVQQDPTIPDIGGLLKGIHAVLAVPLLRDDKVVGGLVIRRRTIGGFAPTIPTLLQTFAGQAVLAIENARLFQELAARGEEARRARAAAEAALADLRRAQDRLIQAEKMASLGQLTAGIAHEIKNPLNFVNNFAGLSVELLDELKEAAAPALAGLDDARRGDIDEIVAMLTGNLDKIAEHGRRADGIVKSMLEHSRGSSGERREVDLNNLVEEALNLAYHGARAQDQCFNITLEHDFAQGIMPIELAPQDVTRVLLNLIGNGFYAATKRGKDESDPKFKPTLRVATRDLGDAVEIRVRDNGTGIPPEIRDKLFQPFFTTKSTGEGTGLGLSISWDIVVQQHGGMITVDSRVGEFTEFAIRLPRTPWPTTSAATSATTTIEAAA